MTSLTSGIWREVSRHVGFEETVERVVDRVMADGGVAGIAVYRLRSERRMLDRVAAKGWATGSDVAVGWYALTDGDLKELEDWTGSGLSAQRGAYAGLPQKALSSGLRGELKWAGDVRWHGVPLVLDGRFAGLVFFREDAGSETVAEQDRLYAVIGECLSTALENDRRLQELRTLRDAAEAEKLAALARLGRERLTDDIIGREGGLRSVMARVAMVARTDVPVLLLGETGTGKEVIARVIHDQSERAKGPFLRVNSGAIPPELMDAELFGHEKGSFTGASAQRRGWFERADGGTLLLDEIGELARPAQVRLLRVLQEGQFERVGGEKTVRVNVRLIAATHRDLPAMVQAGTFREDLWYRIGGFPIVLPPLRERREDIPALARHFARRAARHFGLLPQPPADEDLAVLSRYSWPGNIRELASVIDRAAILGDGRRLEIRRALGTSLESGMESVLPAAPADAALHPGDVFPSLAAAMRRHIEAALRQAQGRIEGDGGAAKLLEINPHTLRARMRKLGIDWASFRA